MTQKRRQKHGICSTGNMMCPKAQKTTLQASQDRRLLPFQSWKLIFRKIVTSEKRMIWLKKLLLEEPCFGCTIVWRSTHTFSGGNLFWQPAYHEKLATPMTQPQFLQNKVTSEGKFGNSNKNHHWTWQHIPPGEDRWRSQLPCIGLSWPLTSHQLFGVASHLLSRCCNVKSLILGFTPQESDRISMNFYLSRKKALIEGRGNWRVTSHPMAIFVFLWLGYCMFKFRWSKYIWVLFWVMFGQQADGFNLLILLYIKHFDRSLCARVDGWNPALPKR